MNIKAEEFLECISWMCSEETKEKMIEIIEKLQPFVISLLLEASSSYMSIAALKKSEQSKICIVNGKEKEIIFNPETSTIIVPENEEQASINLMLMKAMMDVICED